MDSARRQYKAVPVGRETLPAAPVPNHDVDPADGMTVNRASTSSLILAGLLWAAAADGASDRDEFSQRAAREDMAAFRNLDRDGDGRLTHDEVRPDLNFGPRFDDADINRDGVIDSDEMRRYIEQTYGVSPPSPEVGAR
jgi:hypothetical protein